MIRVTACGSYNISYVDKVHIRQTYGSDVYDKILKEATRLNYSTTLYYDKTEEENHRYNTEELKKIIKSQTSEDVFANFPLWYNENWSNEVASYTYYMASIGQPIF